MVVCVGKGELACCRLSGKNWAIWLLRGVPGLRYFRGGTHSRLIYRGDGIAALAYGRGHWRFGDREGGIGGLAIGRGAIGVLARGRRSLGVWR